MMYALEKFNFFITQREFSGDEGGKETRIEAEDLEDGARKVAAKGSF